MNDIFVEKLSIFVKEARYNGDPIKIKIIQKNNENTQFVFAIIYGHNHNIKSIFNAIQNYGGDLFDKIFKIKDTIILKKMFGDQDVISAITSASKKSKIEITITKPKENEQWIRYFHKEIIITPFSCSDLATIIEDIKSIFKEKMSWSIEAVISIQ